MPIRIALASSLVSVALVACGEAAQLGRTPLHPPDTAAVQTANEASAIPPARSPDVGDGRLTLEGRDDDAGIGGRHSAEPIRNPLQAGGMPDVGAGQVTSADAAEGQTGVTASQSSVAEISTASIELNFDHSKAILVVDQNVLVTGALNGRTVNETVRAGDLVSRYFLNNGANFVLVNAVQRLPMVGTPGHARSVAALVKGGLGFMVPHTENTVLGESNQAGFQYGGLGAGLEAGLRVHLFRHLFVEASQKVFYGRYRKLNIAAGTASQDLWAHVTILSAGTTW